LVDSVDIEIFFGCEVQLQDRVHAVEDPAQLACHVRRQRVADVRTGGSQVLNELRELFVVASEDGSEGWRAWTFGEPCVQRALLVSRVRQELMRDRVDRMIEPLVQLVHTDIAHRVRDLSRVLEVPSHRIVLSLERIDVALAIGLIHRATTFCATSAFVGEQRA
jgi:hypothetical protein